MTDLMIRDDLLFFVSKDRILFLISCNDNLNALLQVRLGYTLASVSYGAQSRLIDYVGMRATLP